MKRTNLRPVYVVLFILAVAAAVPHAQEWGEVTASEWAVQAPSDYAEANAVILFDRGVNTIEFDFDGLYPEVNFTRHVRIKILNRAGVDEAANAEFSYRDAAGLEDVEAHTITPDGQVYPVDADDFHDKSVGKWRIKSFAFPHADSGCILEYKYSYYTSSLGGFDIWYFHHPIYTMESEYTLAMSAGYEYQYQTRNIPEGSARPRGVDLEGWRKVGGRAYSWRLQGLPPIKPEPYMTCIEDYMSSVQVRITALRHQFYTWEARDSWEDLAIAFESSIDDYLKKPRSFRKYIRDATKGADDDYEKSKAIYRYVLDNFETRQAGYRFSSHHDDIPELWKAGYGTALEKNLLLLYMLRQAGVDAWPILICTRDNARIDPSWLDLGQFSHLIVFVEVEQGGIYLDASTKYNAYGTLPPECRVNAGLLIDEHNSELVRIVTNDPVSVRADLTTVRLDSEGKASCSTKSVFTGYLAAEYGSRFEATEPEEFVADDLLSDPEGYSFEGYQTEFDSLNRFHVATGYELDKIARRLDNHLIVTPPCCMFRENPFDSERRFFPIDFNYGFVYQNVARIEPPSDASVVSLPADTAITVDGIKYMRSCMMDGDVVQVIHQITVDRPYYDVEEYNRIREFFENVAAESNQQVVLALEG